MNLIHKKSLVAALVVLAMAGCSDRIGDAEQKMAEIRQAPAKPIEPLPEPIIIKDFTYSAGDIRSPFLAPSLQTMQAQQSQQSGIKPDVNRQKEPLEQYDLTELVYRGRVTAPNGKEFGLVQLPDGFIQEVSVGEYMGKSDGKILEITPTQINLEEIVPDSRLGFVYKKTSLVTPN
ncbi:MAG: pilus assembly protein PilP [Moraxella sp.]|nr:pilus assembly protein PilP [Moraxella sp.]